MYYNENIIQKQVIEINVNAQVNGFEFQNEVDSLCRIELKSRLENLLEKYNDLDEVIRIDVLFAEVNYSSLKDFESSFTEKIIQEVEKQLSEKVSRLAASADSITTTVADKSVRLLVFYLQKGFLPWWSGVKTAQQWNELVNNLLSYKNKKADWTILYPVFKEAAARLRLLEIFTEKQFWAFVENILPVNIVDVQADVEIIRASIKPDEQKLKLEQIYKDVLLKCIAEVQSSNMLIQVFSEAFVKDVKSEHPKWLSAIVPDKISTPLLKALISIHAQKPEDKKVKANTKKHITPEVAKVEDKAAKSTPRPYSDVEKEKIYITNAGLVIAAVYMPVFFKDLGLISADGVLNSNKAIAAMHYIVKGADQYEEFESVLPKILCGLELNKPVKKIKLNKKEKQKVHELLESVLEYWAVLKNTSVEGLRISFLQREGRLAFNNNEWTLKVEQAAYDMLLSHLPWTISMIKLPWMNCLLHVEWI